MDKKEEYAYVLDIVPPEQVLAKEPSIARRGFPRNEVYLQVIGDEYFTLMEVTLKPQMMAEVGERIYVGSGTRDKVNKIVKRLKYDELTHEAKANLQEIIEKIVTGKESKFVDFFNTAGPLTLKLHSLELLKGIGKKTLWRLLEERNRKKFTSYDDIRNRVGIDPVKLISERILRELREEDKYFLFTASVAE
ncbi:nucleotide-binding protein [Thermocladium modestius]|uniref:Nucleotide-binding protein n=1 Tax=Thermocladium modestius TaxID=62609 RepID=A0A830GV93_9CREN|nr:DUF655 domain-containing protein [Thermocladium modestius]GGP21904.1 nucleotide-binding protein [Thermocladium modestius]